MCTLAVAIGVFEGIPLLVAANRDEFLDRRSAGPRAWTKERIPFFAPVDLRSSGTWLGISAGRMFAGVTNRLGRTPPDPARGSRGKLVVDALQSANVDEAAGRIAARGPHEYNRYHLLVADERGARLVISTGEKLFEKELGPGIHVVTERSFGAGTDRRSELVESRLRELAPGEPASEELQRLLSIHSEDPFEGTCVHAASMNYGTRSSTIIRLGRRPGELSFLHAEGPPCKTAYEDFSARAGEELGW